MSGGRARRSTRAALPPWAPVLGAVAVVLALVVGLAILVLGGGDEPRPVYQATPRPTDVVSAYDASLEPSAAVLALVPAEARRLEVTDFDQLRLVLGFSTLDPRRDDADRVRFARQVPTTAALTQGRLRPADTRLRADFGIGQDDVAWEASWEGTDGPGGAGAGWVVALRPGTSMAAVQRALTAGVSVLRGGVVDVDRRLVGTGLAPDPSASWAADPDLVALTGRSAVSTYVERGCLPFDTVYGTGMRQQLAAAPALRLRRLDRLDAFAVALGAELATVQLGAPRPDAFDRARIAALLPALTPELGEVLARPVADPSTGRIGYTLVEPAAAARLVRARTLPFAVCPA